MWSTGLFLLKGFFILFALKSLISRQWTDEGVENLAQGMNPALMKVGSWVQSTLMYGLPAGLLWWDWRVGVVIWVIMGVKLMNACILAQARVTSRATTAERQIRTPGTDTAESEESEQHGAPRHWTSAYDAAAAKPKIWTNPRVWWIGLAVVFVMGMLLANYPRPEEKTPLSREHAERLLKQEAAIMKREGESDVNPSLGVTVKWTVQSVDIRDQPENDAEPLAGTIQFVIEAKTSELDGTATSRFERSYDYVWELERERWAMR